MSTGGMPHQSDGNRSTAIETGVGTELEVVVASDRVASAAVATSMEAKRE